MLNEVNVEFWEKIHSSDNLGTHKNNDYNARCDICGDSKTSKDKKRLHLYRKDSYDDDVVKCFNCGYSSNMFNYIKNYHTEYLQEYKRKTNQNLFDNILVLPKIEEKEVIKIDDSLYNIIEDENAPKKFIDLDLSCRKASCFEEASNYLKNRGANPDDFYFSENGLASIDEKLRSMKKYIIYPFKYKDGRVYGFYSRSIENKIFKTYIPQENTGFKIADWFSIDVEKDVYIFEGIFCKLSSGLDNSIAMCGANIPDELLKKLKKPIFVYDNDSRGYLESINIIKKYKNAKVCIWGDDKKFKNYKDINEIYTQYVKDKENIRKFIISHIDDGITALTRLELLNKK